MCVENLFALHYTCLLFLSSELLMEKHAWNCSHYENNYVKNWRLTLIYGKDKEFVLLL
jgi:hypothetical protein